MASEAPLYDLVLMLSVDAEESTRSKILSDVEAMITQAGGAVERNDDWGRRPMAYEIRHQPEAEYHLLQFHAPGSLIEDLSHTLRITDGVVRHRVIKVRPGTPEAPSSIPVVAAVASAPAASSAPTAGSAAGAEAAAAPAES
ncbi:MAG TPA: 30S ribosomal protein S6 [Solirubrobacteraceae bacterium]|nr:30S ribosomal protein S6 [Solirubrobacteraceae bacterium]